ncbi:uncharacterized protein LOC109826691 [Asparagus officinalis]|uniref:uncharacterized protein LOC109826691 n=1 Tax=Asparagus officinalis TaxID=4686 RepID=UPI00098E58DF|nr:uncharacterized protein LOC109826691 [Asparagus officinalis]
MNLPFWNVRGLNKSPKQHLVKQHIHQYHISFVALLETKIKEGKLPEIVKRIAANWRWFSNANSTGTARILMLWDPNILDLQISGFSAQHITCKVCSTDGRLDCYISSIYGFNHMDMRKELWLDLHQIHQVIGNPPWLLSGDFNAMLGNEEKLGGVMLTDADILDFRSFTESCQLSHLKTLGCFYTWNNKQDSATRVWSGLDRSLVNDSWIQIFNSGHVEYLLPSFSDHSPGLISIYDVENRGKKPFKFYKMWINHSSFLPTVSSVWQSHIGGYKMFSVNSKLKLLKGALQSHIGGYKMFSVNSKLKLLKGALKNLNQVHFYNICDQVNKARLEVEDIQKKIQNDPLNLVLISKEKCSISSYNKILNCELSFFQQKAKIAWSIQGDRSTSYFHSVIKSNRHHNRIMVLYNSSGERITEADNITNELTSFFKNLMGTAVVTTKPDINIIKNGYCLNDVQASCLAAPVSKDEIRNAVFSLSDNKSPGPDGFSVSFYKSTWQIIGEEVTNAIEEFFKSGKLLGAINATSITLIPKVNCPKSPSDFRPISCCNCIYKFISKILASRIKPILGCLINEAQCTFVKGRQISNNTLLAHELVKNYGRKTISPRTMLNIDIKKSLRYYQLEFLGGYVKWTWFSKKDDNMDHGMYNLSKVLYFS